MESKHSETDIEKPQNAEVVLNSQDSTNVVLAKIVKLLHSYALVQLPDDKEASLPWREIWPQYKIHDYYTDFRVVEDVYEGERVVRTAQEDQESTTKTSRAIAVGDQILVVDVGKEFSKKNQRMVSHIRACNNPWDQVSTWNDKDVKSFIVEITTDSYAWGTVDPGVRARVSMKGLDELLPSLWKGHQVPLPGDEIAGWFLKDRIDGKNQIVTIDYINYVKSEVSIRDLLVSEESMISSVSLKESRSDSKKTLSSLASSVKVRNILLLDDDTVFLYSLSDYLYDSCSIGVMPYPDYESAMKAIREKGADIDLAIIDVNLNSGSGEQKDHRGIQVAHFLSDNFPKCPIILITGEEIDPEHPEISNIPTLIIKDIVYKPFGIDSLHLALSAATKQGKPLSTFLEKQTEAKSEPIETHIDDIQTSLRDLKESLRAEATVLFCLNPITDEVVIEEIDGPKNKYHDRKEKLAWSPIRDAAFNNECIFTKDVGKHEYPKHRYLRHAYLYKSCVGVPVETGRTSYFAYSLFAFHPYIGKFEENESMRLAKRAAREIGLYLRLKQFEEEVRQMKPLEMMGQAYGSMAHDLSKDLSSDFMIDEIERQLEAGDRTGIFKTLETAKGRILHAQRIVRAFRDMARGQNEEIQTFSAAREIKEIAERLETELREYGSTLIPSLQVDPSRYLKMRRTHLNQLITNIVLNAAQQIDGLPQPFSRKGVVNIHALEETNELGVPWLVIRVSDNGPGIHGRDFERVFDIHYTTKEQGCGMGLDICKKIAESVKFGDISGTVQVSRSILLCGSAFEVRLPISLNEGTLK